MLLTSGLSREERDTKDKPQEEGWLQPQAGPPSPEFRAMTMGQASGESQSSAGSGHAEGGQPLRTDQTQ